MEKRPGGELARIEGRRSRGRLEFIAGNGSLVMSLGGTCMGGSSIEVRGRLLPSLSDCQSYITDLRQRQARKPRQHVTYNLRLPFRLHLMAVKLSQGCGSTGSW